MSNLHICADDTELRTNKSYMLLYFTASFCPPCKRIGPVIQNYSDDPNYKHIDFFKVDIQDCPSIAESYDIKSVPTFILISKQETSEIIQGKVVGANHENLQSLLSSTCKLI